MLTCVGFLFAFTCTPQTAPSAAVPYCDVARPVTWAAADTRETKAEADRENRKWKRFCGAAPAVN